MDERYERVREALEAKGARIVWDHQTKGANLITLERWCSDAEDGDWIVMLIQSRKYNFQGIDVWKIVSASNDMDDLISSI